jgi:hypothetical protein
VRLSEGIGNSLPGSSSERPWSERRDPYVRNVDAVSSNPITHHHQTDRPSRCLLEMIASADAEPISAHSAYSSHSKAGPQF